MLCKYCSGDIELQKVNSTRLHYSSYNGKTTDLDILLDAEEEKGNHITPKLKALQGLPIKAMWATPDIIEAACYIWGRDAIEDGEVTEEEMLGELHPLNLKGWLYDPDMDDGDGGNIYIKPDQNKIL